MQKGVAADCRHNRSCARSFSSASRTDTTANCANASLVETDIQHPADNTLLWDVVRVITRSATRRAWSLPSDHGNALALMVGHLAGDLAADMVLGLKTEQDSKCHRETIRQLKLFEQFPRGQRLRPGRRYQMAASDQG